MNDFFVSRLLDLKTLLGFELFESYQVQKDQPETENVRFERIGRYQFLAFYFYQLWGQERYSAQNRGLLHVFASYHFATAHIAQFDPERCGVHDENIFGLDVAVGDVLGLELAESVEGGFDKVIKVEFSEPFAGMPVLGNKMLEVHFSTLHDDEGVLMFEVLVNFHFGDEVALILDHVVAVFREFLHERDFLEEVAVFVIVFDLDLFEGEKFSLDDCSVYVGVAPAEFLFDLDLGQVVVAFNEFVVREKMVHERCAKLYCSIAQSDGY